MIRVDLYTSGDRILGFESGGHADAGEYGYDIVCSAVSALLITAVNAVETLTNAEISVEQNPEGGYLRAVLGSGEDHDAQVLMKGMALGLREIAGSYPDNIRIRNREGKAAADASHNRR